MLERGQPIIISRELGRGKDRGRLKLMVSGQGACVRPEGSSGAGCRVEGRVGDGTGSEGVAGGDVGVGSVEVAEGKVRSFRGRCKRIPKAGSVPRGLARRRGRECGRECAPRGARGEGG